MKESKNKSVDVILCCYNQQDYIAQAVESILKQKVDAPVRILVADDCSTDHTIDIIKKYEPLSPFKFVYLNDAKNLGLHANYRRAFAAVEAKYTAILEGDDWWQKENHLSQHIQFLEKHKRHSMSFNLITNYFQNNGKSTVMRWPYDDLDHITINLRAQISWGNQIGNLSSCVFRSVFLHELPDDFFKLKYADWELGIMMALKGPIALLRESTSTYRINDQGQWTSLTSKNKQLSQQRSLQELEPLLPSYCHPYIKNYNKQLGSHSQPPFPIPFKYRIKNIVKGHLGYVQKILPHNNSSKKNNRH